MLDGFITFNDVNRILETVYNGITVVNSKGTIVIFNKAAERILQLKASEVLGQPYQRIFPELGDVGLTHVLSTGKSVYNHKVKINKVTIISNRTPVIKNEKIIGAVAVFQDISELEGITEKLKEIEQLNRELDAIIESSYDGIWVTDGEGVTLRVNTTYQKFSGINADEVLGRNMQELVAEGYYSDSATLHVLKQRKPVTLIHTIKTGKKAMVTANPVFDEQGRIWRVVTNVRDITEIINLQKSLEKSQEESRRYQEELQKLKEQQRRFDNIVANSDAMKNVLESATRVAKVDSNVLILGESGVGKGVLAGLIHKLSSRAAGPFVKINCGAIPDNLLESELFGYDKGAFTGANKEGKPGIFELAHLGTLFLDEIGEVPLHLQVKLLQVIQEQRIFRIGGRQPVQLDVRIIAATNKDLETMVSLGTFREDLYYRLNVIPIMIPPLRSRKEDIIPLIMYFMERFNQKYRINKRLSSEALDKLLNYNWPGNIRELENILERIMVMSDADEIKTRHLPLNLQDKEQWKLDNKLPLKAALAELEQKIIRQALQEHGTIRKTAAFLKINHAALIRKIKKYKLFANAGD